MLPRRWKIFRTICILQTILAALMAGISFVHLMSSGSWMQVFNMICFTLIALFAALGSSIVQNNYPDTLLSTPQRRYFNYQYIFNFLLISFIIGHIYSQRWIVMILGLSLSFYQWILVYTPVIMLVLLLFFQVKILYGMFRLRRELYANYLKLIDEIASEQVSQ